MKCLHKRESPSESIHESMGKKFQFSSAFTKASKTSIKSGLSEKAFGVNENILWKTHI